MLSNRKLQMTLEEIKEITGINLALYNDKGKLVAYTNQAAYVGSAETDYAQSPQNRMKELLSLEGLVEEFLESEAESQPHGSFLFYKVIVEGRAAYVLLAESAREESHMVGRLAACQIRNLALANREQLDRNRFMQKVLLETMPVGDMYHRAKRMCIEQAKRLVFIIDVLGEKDKNVIEYVKNMFSSTREFVTEIDETSIILVKDVGRMEDEEEWQQVARAVVDNLHGEAMVRVRVAYGNPAEQLQDVPRSFQEAKIALEVGKVFYMERETLAYAKLGIGRLLYQLPRDLCGMFLKEVFGDQVPDVFDEETNMIIQKFFENNLNISETARQLFVHRNTLVYRLDRIQKAIGLDVRVFEDAMIFRIALMVMAQVKQDKENGKQ